MESESNGYCMLLIRPLAGRHLCGRVTLMGRDSTNHEKKKKKTNSLVFRETGRVWESDGDGATCRRKRRSSSSAFHASLVLAVSSSCFFAWTSCSWPMLRCSSLRAWSACNNMVLKWCQHIVRMVLAWC
jgi:hypothetical protein